MNKRFFIVSAILFAAISLAVFGLGNHESVLPDVSQSDWELLENGEALNSDTLGGDTIIQLAPVDSYAYEKTLECEHSTDSFTVASAALIPYPENWKDMDTEQRQLAIYNTIRHISTQAGITYISHRAGDKPKELFSESYYVSDPEKKKSKIDDPVAEVLPPTELSYVYQKDSSFGGNVYVHKYQNTAEEIFLEVTNYTPMKVFGAFKALDEGQLSLFLDTYQMEEGLYVYSMAKITGMESQITVLFITVDLPSAFRRRITSIREWLQAQVAAVDQQ